MKPHIASIFLAAFALAAPAAVVQRWTVETSRVQPVLFDAFHGESIDLQASLNSYGTPLDLTGKTATLFWQTNGMNSAYWQTNAVTIASNTATAHFTGAMDPGAATVRGFIGFAGENYRASFILRFRDSPGFAPAAIPLPTRSLDFATTIVVHPDEAPFVMKGGAGGVDAASVTNIAGQVATNVVPAWARAADPPATGVTGVTTNGASAVVDGVAHIVFPAPPPTDRISNATHVITADRQFITPTTPWKILRDGVDVTSQVQQPTWYYFEAEENFVWFILYATLDEDQECLHGVVASRDENATSMDWIVVRQDPERVVNYTATRTLASTTLLATTNDIPDVSELSDTVSGWETYWRGDRVRISVTNYYGNSSGEPPRLMIQESRTNAQGVVTGWTRVWDELTRQTNYQHAIDAKVDAISNNVMTASYRQTTAQLAAKAPRAWGEVTSSGAKAPANTVWHTAPNTVFAGGTEYAHVAVGEGVICVLSDNGAPVYTEGAEGQFRFTDDSGRNYFGFDVRDAYSIGCRTDGISVSAGLVTLTYDLTSDMTPEILHCTNLLEGVWAEIPAEWDQSPPTGTKICYINVGSNPQGYYKAQLSYAAEAKFITNMMADLAGGIAATNESGQTTATQLPVYPVVTPSNVEWRVRWSN